MAAPSTGTMSALRGSRSTIDSPVHARRGEELIVRSVRDEEDYEREPAGSIRRLRDGARKHLDDLAERSEALAHGVDGVARVRLCGRRNELHAKRTHSRVAGTEELLSLERGELRGERGVEIEILRSFACRGRRVVPIFELRERGKQRRWCWSDRRAALERSHAKLDRPRPAKKRVDGPLPERAARAIRRPEHGLHLMRDGDDGLDADHRREPLQRVQRTKEIAHGARITLVCAVRSFGHEKLRVRDRKLFVGLGDVRGAELLQVDARSHPAPPAIGSARGTLSERSASTSARMTSGANGLAKKRDAPAASTCWRETSSPRVVTTRMGSARSLS